METQIQKVIILTELQQLLIDLEVYKLDDFEVKLKTDDDKFHDCEMDTFQMISNC